MIIANKYMWNEHLGKSIIVNALYVTSSANPLKATKQQQIRQAISLDLFLQIREMRLREASILTQKKKAASIWWF